MENKKENTQTQNIKVDNSIYSEDNLITGAIDNSEVKQEFENWYKVKIEGLVKSYKLHEDGSLQIKFQEEIQKEVDNVKFTDYEDRSIRIRKKNPFTPKEAEQFLNKAVEIVDIEEKPQYKKIADGNYDFSKPIGYFYSADNIKVINKTVENNYQLYKVFELTVKQVTPAITYNKRARKQELDKKNSVLIYEIQNDTLTSLHKIIVKGLSYQESAKYIGKDLVVLDLNQKGTQNYCSKIKLK